MPQGCEDKFAWAKQLNDILKTKYPYGMQVVQCHVHKQYAYHYGIFCYTKSYTVSRLLYSML